MADQARHDKDSGICFVILNLFQKRHDNALEYHIYKRTVLITRQQVVQIKNEGEAPVFCCFLFLITCGVCVRICPLADTTIARATKRFLQATFTKRRRITGRCVTCWHGNIVSCTPQYFVQSHNIAAVILRIITGMPFARRTVFLVDYRLERRIRRIANHILIAMWCIRNLCAVCLDTRS